MSKLHNILDASTLVKKYRKETGWEIALSLFRHKDCALHILNTTIPEVIGVFVRWELKGEIDKGQWEILRDLFIEDIINYNLIVHNITHRNIVDTDRIWKTSMRVKPSRGQNRTKPRIGPIDVMVLSVASELKTIYKYENVYLFTSDNHMFKVASRLKIKTCDPEGVMVLPF